MKKLFFLFTIFFCLLMKGYSQDFYAPEEYDLIKTLNLNIEGTMEQYTIDDSNNFLIIATDDWKNYRIIIYKIGTWEKYEIKSQDMYKSLNSCYFSNEKKIFYYKELDYKKKVSCVDLGTGIKKVINCSKAPNGCDFNQKNPIYNKKSSESGFQVQK